MESILISIKKMLGIQEDYDHFDSEIAMHINSVLMILTQIGVGPSGGFVVENCSSTWTEFVSDADKMAAIKSYVYLKVKLLFDPPTSSFVLEAIKQQISELEWRLNILADTQPTNNEPIID